MDYGKGRCVPTLLADWCVQGPAAQTWTSRLFRLLTLLCTGLPARGRKGEVRFASDVEKCPRKDLSWHFFTSLPQDPLVYLTLFHFT